MLEKMDAFFENRLSGYDEHMLTSIEGAQEFYAFTASELPAMGPCRVLDLGCGTGLELEQYLPRNPAARITGIDLSQGMLSEIRRKFAGRQLHLICGSYFEVPFGRDVFDAAVSVESLHHFPAERKQVLYGKLHRALKRYGYLILTDYFAESAELEQEYFENYRVLKAEQGITDDGFYHYDTPLTVEHEIQVLEAAGFSRVAVLCNWGATYTIKAVR